MGSVDKNVRISIAFVLGFVLYTNATSSTLVINLLVLVGIFVFISFCPLYLTFGISLSKKIKSN
ncbi:MAG: DUF2892 domain-containing protein [Polaribacter sp.]|uniref:YgaP family membrane protein n=1 Tax=Polaribacter sp. TaxID=1920175 RepID=UPI0026067CBE|nr:DUF2892 domain-containing protein [uncultured Polaribacter sp.]